MNFYQTLFFFLILKVMTASAQINKTETYQYLPFGSIKPSGWLKIQMQKDLNGFVGNMDKLVPDLINDPIYGPGRLHKNSVSKDLGNLKAGDAGGEEQYKWWNSETQSNWWDGYIRNAFLLEEQAAIEKVKSHIDQILATQDEDGYLGIYDKDLRYQFNSENGELWSKATLYRGLLAYYEVTGDKKVWNALVKAVDNVMKNYPVHASSPFSTGNKFNGGVSHGLTFTDVLDSMFYLTKDKKYLDYALFLYQDFSATYQSEGDAQLMNILNPAYKLRGHGVHTFEHLRPLLVAAYASNDPDLFTALDIYSGRLEKITTATGGAIGDEWIAGRNADATHTGYEYCSLHELLHSYTVLFQRSGKVDLAAKIEQLFYNAAQGARNPDHSSIAYLKTDNSFEMLGTKNGETEPDRKQTRYKYSPVHQDVAVCCSPNAGRISPYFLQASWFKENENTLVAALLGPNVLQTSLQNVPVKIEAVTDYPYRNKLIFNISAEKALTFQIKIRKPEWTETIQTNEVYKEENGFVVIERTFKKADQLDLEFKTSVKVKEDQNQEKYFTWGALVYALPIEATEQKGKVYAPGFEDLYYTPKISGKYAYLDDHQAHYKDGTIDLTLKNSKTRQPEQVTLIPLGKTILRQVTFK